MSALETVRDGLPDAVRDIKLNLQAVMQTASLSHAQRHWRRHRDCGGGTRPGADGCTSSRTREVSWSRGVIDDALAAASLMAMTNVYYRFRHLVGKARYAEMPARLRHEPPGAPGRGQARLRAVCARGQRGERYAETCVQAHERVLVAGGLTEEQIHDAVRLAAVVHATACARLVSLPQLAGEVAA